MEHDRQQEQRMTMSKQEELLAIRDGAPRRDIAQTHLFQVWEDYCVIKVINKSKQKTTQTILGSRALESEHT